MKSSGRVCIFLWILLGFCPAFFAQAGSKALTVEDALSGLSFADRTPLAISPDGTWVAYSLRDVRRLETPKAPKYKAFTPSGVPTEWSATDVWVTNLRTGETKNLTQSKGSAWAPAWSPNGETMLFYSDRGGAARLWAWDRNSGNLRQVSDVIVHPFFGFQVPVWSPDGKRVLVKVLPKGLTLEGAADLKVEAPPVTGNQSEQSSVTVKIFSFDASAKLESSFEKDKEESWTNRELGDLAFIDLATGAVDRIATGVKPMGYWISPDGARVAFTSLKGRKAQNSQQAVYELAMVKLPENQIRVVAPVTYMEYGISVSWSPDGNWLSYTMSEPSSKVSGKREPGECFLAPAEGGESRKLTQKVHPDFGRSYRAPVWSPDGKYIYFVAANTLWEVGVKDGAARELAKDPQRRIVEIVSAEVGDSFWTTDSGRSMFVRTRNAETKQVGYSRVNLESGELTKLIEEDKEYGPDGSAFYSLDVSADGKTVVYIAGDAQHSPDLWTADINFRSPHRVTQINPQFDAYTFGRSRLIDYRSSDGVPLHGALLLPSDYQEGKRYPLVVYVYGGSFGSNNVNRFGLAGTGVENKQLLATRGYAVLFPDTPLHPGTPMADLAKTVIPAVNKVVELGIADPDRIGVMGHSYGGYSTLALIVQSKLFRAAIDSAGIGNLIAMYGAMGRDGSAWAIGWLEEGQGSMGGTPWQFRDRYLENSPTLYLDRVETPLLIVQGGIDNTVPPFLADEVFVGLRRLEKKVVYAKYAGEDHWEGTWGHANAVDYLNRVIAWFDQEMTPRSGKEN
jgi:dipeptidyl aminopeptidase/acylaminoacyl peptidase